MASIFDKVKANQPNRSVFDLSHDKKMTADFGKLYPVFLSETLPGDSFRVNTEIMARMMPLVSPMMHRCNIYMHYFFVPSRLLWDNWETFITGGRLGTESPAMPRVELTSVDDGDLADYLGLPSMYESPTKHQFACLLPFRAYQKIYNDYYRDQNLEDEVPLHKDEDGTVSQASVINDLLQLRNRCWERDYFTSALPWTQRGEEVRIPVVGDAPIRVGNYNQQGLLMRVGNLLPTSDSQLKNSATTSNVTRKTLVNGQGELLLYDPNGSLYADLEAATSATINDLRASFQLQKWLERNARSGARYTEQIKAHFGVQSSDARLQRAEYLGGGVSPIVISEVLQTSQSDLSPQGNMAGHGISVQNNNGFRRFFEEHGYIMGIMSIIPRSSYQEGIPRHFLRNDKLDYFWPEFANLGEQEVYNKELYFDAVGNDDWNDNVFGYQARYQEYRYAPSTVHGQMRSTLDYWHLGRRFMSRPGLSSSFVHVQTTDGERVFANQNDDKFVIQLYNSVQAIRPIPKVGTPGLIDH